MTRLIFMGTPDFSVPSLSALVEAGYDLVAVVTQPDRPHGRGRQLKPPPVKQFALEHGFRVLQPPSLRRTEAVAELEVLHPDLIVVVAYGQILRPAVLDLPPAGCINVHASLLPRWRGAAPIQAAILAGDEVTGSTIMLMDEGMDTGPILAQAALRIGPDETAGVLSDRLAHQGAALLVKTLPLWLEGELSPQPQDEELATICRLLSKDQGRVNWTLPAEKIAAAVRAFNPWPGASTSWNGIPLKILRARPVASVQAVNLEPGTVLEHDGGIAVSTGEGLLELGEIQLAGRRAVSAQNFVLGHSALVGSRLGN